METYLGSICIFGFNYSPYGWQLCNGQILPISSNAALFSLLGTNYGGNGTSTFGLPNLQGRTSIHMGQLSGGSLYTMGEFGGVESITVLPSNLPPHSHNVNASVNGSNANAGSATPGGNVLGVGLANVNFYNTSNTGTMASFNVSLGASGGTTPITISDPALVMNYSIAMQGIFPTRN